MKHLYEIRDYTELKNCTKSIIVVREVIFLEKHRVPFNEFFKRIVILFATELYYSITILYYIIHREYTMESSYEI